MTKGESLMILDKKAGTLDQEKENFTNSWGSNRKAD